VTYIITHRVLDTDGKLKIKHQEKDKIVNKAENVSSARTFALLYYGIGNSIKPQKVDSSRHMQFGNSRSGAICQKIQQYIRIQKDNKHYAF